MITISGDIKIIIEEVLSKDDNNYILLKEGAVKGINFEVWVDNKL